MNGTSHAAIGAITGFFIANNYQADPKTTVILVAVGGVTGLVPDLDIGGKLRRRLTIPHTYIRNIARLIGILLTIYSLFQKADTSPYIAGGIGATLFLLASIFKQKHMLMVTAFCVFIGGYLLEENWILLFGVYIFIASVSSHRSYTHSLVALCLFSFIGYLFEQSIGIEGIYYTCLFGYISHLIADSRLLPFNKRGVPLFLPLSQKEI